jgi:uncharacterized protein
MKRILSLDGGGIRGVFSLEILLRIQELLRMEYGSPDLVLADHFDLFAGTSTGAIIATCLCWGMSVEEILRLYVEFGAAMFRPVPWYRPIKKLLISRYQAKPISDMLMRLFSEDGEGKIPALLDSDHLKKTLLVVVRNHTTGAAWPLTNNVKALYNSSESPDCNLKIPLWKVVRASTAAPVYFDPEEIEMASRTCYFVDGSITPYNNPSLIAALTATLPCYKMNWAAGAENIRVVSLGTLRFSSGLSIKVPKLWLGFNAARIPTALIDGIAWQQDYLSRCLGQCIYGEELDSEIGDMIGVEIPGPRLFSYVRYNQSYKIENVEAILEKNPEFPKLDGIHSIPMLRDVGRTYASQHVRIEHLI